VNYMRIKRNTVTYSDPLRKNENTLLLNRLNNTVHKRKKRSPTKKKKTNFPLLELSGK